MKIFFDSNIYVSEFAFGGLAATVVQATVDARWRIFVNEFVVDESCRVLREDFQYLSQALHFVRQDIQRRAEVIDTPPSRHHVPADPDDDQVLQGAVSAGADYLVSSDRHLLSLNPYESIRIVSLAAFRQILINHGLLTP